MALNPELLKILVCPQCKGKIILQREEETLTCMTCKLVYSIEDDIPVMLVEHAQPLDNESSETTG